jgi:hypothetical protein
VKEPEETGNINDYIFDLEQLDDDDDLDDSHPQPPSTDLKVPNPSLSKDQ